MSYVTDGSIHYRGIEGENQLTNQKKQLEKLYNKKIKNILGPNDGYGGTGQLADNCIVFLDNTKVLISLKKAEGTINYINTTKFNKLLIPKTVEFFNNHTKTEKFKEQKKLKKELGKLIRSEMPNFSEFLTKFIKETIVDRHDNEKVDMIIMDNEGNLRKGEPAFFEEVRKGYKAEFKFGKGFESAPVKINNKNTGITFRLTLNNGTTKWLRSDFSCSLCIKVQQSVNKTIDSSWEIAQKN